MRLAILIVTYNRREILETTIMRLWQMLAVPWHETVMVVADDGSTDGTHELVNELSKEPWKPINLVVSNRKGLGANTNAGLRKAFEFSDVVLQLQDDLHLERSLDLTKSIELLEQNPRYGWVKLSCISEPRHQFTADLDGHFWKVRWDSKEFYMASDKPHLKHKRFHDHFGYYPEGLKVGQTENEWCARVNTKARAMGGPAIAIPTGIEDSFWAHVGDSWQGKGL